MYCHNEFMAGNALQGKGEEMLFHTRTIENIDNWEGLKVIKFCLYHI